MSSKQIVVQFVYPHSAASTFNLDYYLSHHLPLVGQYWGPRGLLSWTVTKGAEGTDYFLQTTIFWESLEAFEKVKSMEEIMGDVKNFSNEAPTIRVGLVVGQGGNLK